MEQAPAILIPARRASTRLPDKLLLAESGKPLLAHVCERAAEAFGPEAVTVCADDPELVTAAEAAGVRAVMTRADHQSGSDRIAEVARALVAKGWDPPIVVNIQGDEPEIDPAHIRLVAELLLRRPWAGIATLATTGDVACQANPNQVKVVLGAGDRALWFTRAPAPYDRDAGRAAAACHRHLGIYAYRTEVLLRFATLPPGRLELLEKLEQLRALENGIAIACGVVEQALPGIDTRNDYDAFLLRSGRTEPAHKPK